jgi:phosphoribosylaminoimidazole-succinocarboxamide synthase
MNQQTLASTNFNFPGQTAVYHGKVRDVYTFGDKYVALVATDRISCFDIVLPRQIPLKGQVLNQIADHFLQATVDIVPNWLISVPDPNVSFGKNAVPVKIEMVIRGSLVGSAWRQYRDGKREICGEVMPEGMQEYDRFPVPLITPTSKADEGHDEDLTPKEIVEQGLATESEWQLLCDYTRKLFARGQQMAAERGLELVDTKYEFGKVDGQIILIDEIHTPDSSRYFYKDSYEKYLGGDKSVAPKPLSKEFVREWLMERNFMNQPGQEMPELTDDFIQSVTERYIELFEQLTGKEFIPAPTDNILNRIETNVTKALEQLS